MIGVGGFQDMSAKDVIVPFGNVNVSKKDNKWWLTIVETKASLKAAQGFAYDRDSTTGEPDTVDPLH